MGCEGYRCGACDCKGDVKESSETVSCTPRSPPGKRGKKKQKKYDTSDLLIPAVLSPLRVGYLVVSSLQRYGRLVLHEIILFAVGYGYITKQ